MKRVTIAIDGPAGSGKSTVAKEVAKRLNFVYVDTGAMYRAVALNARRMGIAPDDEPRLKEMLEHTDIKLVPNGDNLKVLLNGEDVTLAIRTEQVGMDASTYSAKSVVREKMVQLQRELGKAGGVVMEGRDIGTVVFPQAQRKFFLSATPEERARRRAKELKERGIACNEAEILKTIQERDLQDSTRSLAPLKPAPDAVVIDTTGISVEDVILKVLAVIPLEKKGE